MVDRATDIIGMSDPQGVDLAAAEHIRSLQENVRRLQDQNDNLAAIVNGMELSQSVPATDTPQLQLIEGEGITIRRAGPRATISASVRIPNAVEWIKYANAAAYVGTSVVHDPVTGDFRLHSSLAAFQIFAEFAPPEGEEPAADKSNYVVQWKTKGTPAFNVQGTLIEIPDTAIDAAGIPDEVWLEIDVTGEDLALSVAAGAAPTEAVDGELYVVPVASLDVQRPGDDDEWDAYVVSVAQHLTGAYFEGLDTTEAAAVALTGSYLDLIDKPTLLQGETGPEGPAGADSTVPGPQGIQGPAGVDGNDGAQGVQGNTGPQGIQGNTGAKGDTGDTGPQGNTGADGADGAQGAQGVKGDTGDTGAQGIQGPEGPAGSDADLTAHEAASNPHGITKGTVALGNVDNTADLSKPLSNAAQTALAEKAELEHEHAIGNVGGLQTALDSKSATDHTHANLATAGHEHGLEDLVDVDLDDPAMWETYATDPGDAAYNLGTDEESSVGAFPTTQTLNGLRAGYEGLNLWVCSRAAYYDTGDMKLYGYARKMIFNEFGRLYKVSAETRYVIDEPVEIPEGDTGATGEQGIQGPQGDKGDTGDAGAASTVPGPKGETGPQGDEGPQGIQGATGAKGDTGSQGVKGDTGNTGSQGIQGPQGDTGPQGVGDTGPQGIQGVKGDDGDTGPAGADGVDAGTGYTMIDQSGGTGDTYGSLVGSVNGSNKLFTVSTAEYVSGTMTVAINGQLQTQGSGEDWVETSPTAGTFTLATAPQTGDKIVVSFLKVTATNIDNADTLDGQHGDYYAARGGFVDRGDLSGFDFANTDLIMDGTYRTLDLSSIIPTEAKAVLLRTQMTDTIAGKYLQLRKNGNVNNYAGNVLRVQVAGFYTDAMMIIPVDANGCIEYRGIAATGNQPTALDIGITGWFI